VPDGRVTLREASVMLGVSEGAIRKRVARGTIRSEMGDDGLRYVWVDAGTDGVEDASSPRESEATRPDRDELVESLRDQLAYLRDQLDVRAREIERKDSIIMALSQSNAELSRTIRAIEPAQDATEESETVEEGVEPRSDAPRPEEAVQRPWWRRVFGGG